MDVIEAGFPIASQGRFRGGARGGGGRCGDSTVAGLARARREDIEAVLGALEAAARPRVHVFLATSDLHLKYKLRISRAEALDSIGTMVAFAQGALPGGGVFRRGFQPQRSGISGAGVCDRGGCGRDDPERAGHGGLRDAGGVRRDCFARCGRRLSDRPGLVWSAHCHNDLGLAVANSLAAVAAGARQVECAINGIGERAGNAALEEIAVALAVRRDHYQAETRLKLSELCATSRLLTEITRVPVPPNKAVVGANAFAHEAGIHQDGILKNPLTYQVISPEAVGVPAHKLVLGKHSGRNALRARLADLGVSLSDDELRALLSPGDGAGGREERVNDADMLRLARAARGGRGRRGQAARKLRSVRGNAAMSRKRGTSRFCPAMESVRK